MNDVVVRAQYFGWYFAVTSICTLKVIIEYRNALQGVGTIAYAKRNEETGQTKMHTSVPVL